MYVVSHSWNLVIRYYEEGLAAASGVKDLLQLAKMHHGLAMAYQHLRQPATARQHFDKALTLYSLESDLSAVYRVENDMGHLYLQEGLLDSAEQHLLRALAGATELSLDLRGRGFILANLGDVYLRKGQLAEAAVWLTQAIDLAEATGERIVQAEAYLLVGQLDERNGDRHTADDDFSRAIRILEELNMPERLRDAHMDYAELLEARQDISAASRHWRQAAEIGKAAALGIKLTRATSDREFEESLA
jgi:Tfp pilus assembly protein PilF